MKNFFKTIIFIFILVACISLYFVYTVNVLNKDYLVSYGRGFEKKFNKLQSIQSNKIVIVGGSNVNFGIDSDLMEVSLGIPVVNMGLHAGLNTFNIIAPITPYLKRGDVLIISREFNEKLYGASVEVSNYFQFMPLKARLESFKNLEAISPILKCHIQNSQNNIINNDFKPQNKFKEGVYTANAFKNDNMERNVIDFEMPIWTYSNLKVENLTLPNDLELYKFYQELSKNLNSRGITVLFSLPSISDNCYLNEDMVKYYRALSNKTGIKMLSEKTFEFPREKLLNSEYHLNAIGRNERSLELSKELAKFLNINLKTVEHVFSGSSVRQNISSFKLNDFWQGELKGNQLTFINYDKGSLNNYYRIKVEGDVFTNKTLKIEIEGDKALISDIKFRAVGEPQDWDLVYTDNNKHVFVKNNVQGTIYMDGNSYLGISLNNLDKHNNSSIKIHKIEVSDPSVKTFCVLPLSKSITIDSRNSSNKLKIELGKDSNSFYMKPNRKYVIKNLSNALFITDLYSNKICSIIKAGKLEENQIATIYFPSEVIEVYEF